jgi:hypothetical protein
MLGGVQPVAENVKEERILQSGKHQLKPLTGYLLNDA